MNRQFIQDYTELRIYQLALDSAHQIYREILTFPNDEKELLSRDLVSASRWICGHLAEAWTLRGSVQGFENTMLQVGARAARMQVWIEIGIQCGYLDAELAQELYQAYSQIRQDALRVMNRASAWTVE